MSKIVIGLGAAAIVAVGGYFGAEAYIKHRIAGEIEANFAQIRASGGQAKHGDLAFSLWTRDVTISDIGVEFTAPQPANIKVSRFTASNIGIGSATTFSADSIILTDIEAAGSVAASDGINVAVKAPRFEIVDYSGPTRLKAEIKPSSPLDMYRAGLDQFAAIAARTMTAPRVTMTAKGAALQGGAEYAYSDVVLRDIKNGKVAAMSASRVEISMTVAQAGKAVRMNGDIVDLKAQDFDAAAAAAVLDPARASDTQFYRIQGPVSTGAYTLKSDNGPAFRIDGMRMGDTKIQPSKFKLQELLAALPAPGAAADPARARLMIETVANVYEGIQMDKAEMLGLSVDGPQGPMKLASMRFNLDRGKIGEFAFEGLEGKSPEGPFKVGRFALKGFDFSGLMRQASRMTVPGTTPSTETAVGMLKALEGIELRDTVAPYKKGGKTVSIEHASLDWSQFVGPIPSKARLTLKMTGPLEEKDGEPFTLLRDVGIDEATANIDIGIAWNEGEKKLTLTPGTFEINKLFALTAELSLDNVLRDLFTTNPQQALVMTSLIKPSRLKMTLRDLGGVDLALVKNARERGITIEEARRAVMAEVWANSEALAARDPAIGKMGAAIAAFIEKPRSMMTVSITPKQSLRLLEMIDRLKANDPDTMISLFQVDAQTGP